MKKKLLIMSLCSFLLVCAGCKKSVKLKNGEEIIASVKGKNISADELFEEYKEKYGSAIVTNMIDEYIVTKEFDDDKAAKEYAKVQFANMKAQYEAMGSDWEDVLNQYGYTEETLTNEYITDYKKKEVAKKYIKKDITDKEIEEYYDKEIYGKYTVKHILIAPDVKSNASSEDKEEAKEKALKEAKEVIKKLDNGEKWKDLVKKYSDDKGSVKDEGLIKDFTKGDVVDEFFDATLELKNGKYTKEPVESTYGYHIILKVSNTKKPSLKDSKKIILDKISNNKLSNDDKLYTNTWIKIRKDYKISIKDSKLKNAYNKSISN